MSDRLFFPLIGFAALAIIALALVWPQGIGRRSPALFGHDAASESMSTPKLRTPVVIGKPPPQP